MNVRSILDEKGYNVETIGPSASLREAAERMAARRIGALVVINTDRQVIGILSERDLVRVIGLEGPERLDDEVDTVMTTKVVTSNGNETVPQLMEQMTAGRFRHIPVVQNGKLVGLVSIGDVVKHRLADFERESSAMREYILST